MRIFLCFNAMYKHHEKVFPETRYIYSHTIFCHYSVILSELYSLYVVSLSAEVGTVVPEDVRCKCTHPSSVHLHWLNFMCFTVAMLVVGFVFAGKLALVENMMTMMVVLVLNQFFVQLLATETLNQRKTGDFAALIVPIFLYFADI